MPSSLLKHIIAAETFCRPFSISNPLRGCNSDLAQCSNTPVFHHSAWPDFKDDDKDENEAPGEGGTPIYSSLRHGPPIRLQNATGLPSNWTG